jgi:hypothetical protein
MPPAPELHTARCACGALTVAVEGPPVRINGCTCLACQRRSGSAFSYTAFFADAAVRLISGAAQTFREQRASGRWHDSSFCPVCGVTVYCRLEALPGLLGVAVGCFGDPAFPAPELFYWTTHRHHWLAIPEGIGVLGRQ